MELFGREAVSVSNRLTFLSVFRPVGYLTETKFCIIIIREIKPNTGTHV